jgi:DNA invertase Pin-like site-specific DNA recombinase
VALGYVRVDAASPADFESHAAAIRACCAQHGLELAGIVRDAATDRRTAANRPGLFWALTRLAAGEARTLIIAVLDHLSSTTTELASIIDWFGEHERRLIVIDVRLDTSTGAGRMAAETLSAVGARERERISARTRQRLETARSRGSRSGRPAVADAPALQARILRMRAEGMTLRAIADVLNAEGVPTVRGGAEWRASSVQAATGYRRRSAGRRFELPAPQRDPPNG